MAKQNLDEIGVSGVEIQGGVVLDEFLDELRDERGRRTFRQMARNDATVGAVLYAIKLLIRNIDSRVVPAEADFESEGIESPYAAWLSDALYRDMDHTWDDFITDALTMLEYGWSVTEIVYKLRRGPNHKDPRFRSRYNDGKYGIRKIALRSQLSLDRWEIDEAGTVLGMHQIDYSSGRLAFIPIERAIHFRTENAGGNPEGRSVLRTCYRSWFLLHHIQDIEAIAIERELNGLPVIKLPGEYLQTNASADKIQKRQEYEKLARDIKINSQGGALIPSNPYTDPISGNYTNVPMVELTLLSSDGNRAIDTDVVVLRYQRDIARTVLADVLMLGSGDTGSWALSKDKSSLLVQAIEALVKRVYGPINRYLIPRIWEMNGFPEDRMPTIETEPVAQVDIEKLAEYVQRLAAAGAPLFPDEELESYLREQGGLPQSGEEVEE